MILTREQIEFQREQITNGMNAQEWGAETLAFNLAQLNALCDLALAALESRSEVRDGRFEAFAHAVTNMVTYGPWDLRDSPKSFISNVQRLCNELLGISPRAEPGAPYDPAKKVVEGKPIGPWKDEAPGPASAAPEIACTHMTCEDVNMLIDERDSAHARGFAEGLEEAAKVCEQIDELTMFIGRPISTEAEFHTMVRELFFLKARAIRAKIKPTRGET